LKPFSKITIKIISHYEQRYDTAGDWWPDPEGVWHITVSDLGDPRYNALIAVHELIEMILCCERGITPEMVDAFDIGYDGKFPNDPGIDPLAPYHREHMAATVVERDLARKLHVAWDPYIATIDALPPRKP